MFSVGGARNTIPEREITPLTCCSFEPPAPSQKWHYLNKQQEVNMTNHLIPTFVGIINHQPQNVVNARELHQYLEVGRDFSTWIKNRIEDYQFQDNIDYSPILGNQVTKRLFGGNQRQIDYHLTLNMAKELCMLERNEKGRQARRYFIEMENRAQNQVINIAKLIEVLKAKDPKLNDITRYYEMGLSLKEIGKLVSLSYSAILRRMHQYKELGLINWSPNPKFSEMAHKANKQLELI